MWFERIKKKPWVVGEKKKKRKKRHGNRTSKGLLSTRAECMFFAEPPETGRITCSLTDKDMRYSQQHRKREREREQEKERERERERG